MGVYSNTIHGSYSDKIKAVYQHLDEIKKVADRLTPVEDVQVFQSQIEDIHSRLDVIVEASNIIVDTTVVGEAVITSPSWTALRELLGLEEFPSDVVYVHMLQQALDLLWAQINSLVNGLEFEVPPSVIARLEQLEVLGDSLIFDVNSIRTDNSAFSSLVYGIQHTYSDLSGNVNFMQETLSGMEASYSAFGNSLTSMVHNYTSIYQEYENLNTQVSAAVSGYDGLYGRMNIAEDNIFAQAGHLVEVNSQLLNLEAGVSANANALTELETTVEYTDQGVQAVAHQITELAAVLEFDFTTGIATAISELSSRVTQNAGGITAQSERMDDLDAYIVSEDFYLDSHASFVLNAEVGIIDGRLNAHTSQITTLTNTLERRNRTIINIGEPTQNPTYPWVIGDIWIDPSQDNKLHTWAGSPQGWQERELAGGVKIHLGVAPPPSPPPPRVGDLWIDEDNDNRMRRWNGSSWAFVDDQRVEAHSSAIEELESTVNDDENGVEALASKLTELTTDVGGYSAQISESMEVAVRSMQNNYIENPSFEEVDGTLVKGWGSYTSGEGPLPTGFTRGGTPYTGQYALNITSPVSGTLWNRARMRVIPGNHVQIGCRYRRASGSSTTNGTFRFVLRAYGVNGNYMGELDPQPTFEDWTQVYQEHISYITVPNNIYEIQVGIRVQGTAAPARIDDVYLRNMSSQEMEMSATHTLEMDVNGYVSGTRSMNDGVTSSFTVNADKFKVESPGGYGPRLEWSDGSLQVYDTNSELRIRIGLVS